MRQPVRLYCYRSPAGVIEVELAGTTVSVCRFVDNSQAPLLSTGDDNARALEGVFDRYFATGVFDAGVFRAAMRGTAFQIVVWQCVCQIPCGSAVSYGDLARITGSRTGRPTHARAVARAVAANETALFVPCHRVVCADGAPGGYRWGVDRKIALLNLEAVQAVNQNNNN